LAAERKSARCVMDVRQHYTGLLGAVKHPRP